MLIIRSDTFNSSHSLSYWRTASGYEIDAVLGDAKVAIGEEHPEAKLIIVSMDINPRMMSGVEVWLAVQ